MEKELKIKTTDNKKVYGVLRTPKKFIKTKTITKLNKNIFGKGLVVLVHGLTGHKNEHHLFNAARFFEKKNYATFRFDLYSYEKDQRRLDKCTLKTHAQDLDSVISFFRRHGASKIFVAGHSYGGLTILLSKKKDYNAIALWDATYNPKFFKGAKYIKEENAYVLDWGVKYIIGGAMIKEAKVLTPTKCNELIKNVHVPIKIIVAGNGDVEMRSAYVKNANEPKAYAVIKGATHVFDEDGTEEMLFKETYDWFRKF